MNKRVFGGCFILLFLRYLKGSGASVEKNTRAVKLLKEFGFRVCASFVIGSPDESEDEIAETYRYVEKLGVDVGETYVLVPFPETKVWEDLVLNWWCQDWSKFGICMDEDRVVVSRVVDRERLLFWEDKFRKLWRRKKFGYFVGYYLKRLVGLVE